MAIEKGRYITFKGHAIGLDGQTEQRPGLKKFFNDAGNRGIAVMVAADAVFLSYGVLTDDTAHYVRKLHDLAISGAVLVMELAAATGVPLGHSLWCSMVLSSGIATATVSGHRRFEKIEKDIWRIVKRSEMEQEQETHQKPG